MVYLTKLTHMVKYRVALTKAEQTELMSIIGKGHHSSQTFRSAYILLNCDEGKHSQKVTNEQVSQVLKVGMRTIDRIKKRYVEGGLEAVLERKPSSRVYEKIVDGDLEAHLIALSCSKPPKGFAKWSLRLLADKMIELNYADKMSYETVRRVLKKTNSGPGK